MKPYRAEEEQTVSEPEPDTLRTVGAERVAASDAVSLLPACRPLRCDGTDTTTTFELRAARAEVKAIVTQLSAGARLFGVGEASHGASEHIRWKHEIVQALAEDPAFTLIIFEVPFGSCCSINRYVTRGIGTAREAIVSNPYDLFHTREMLEFVETLRAVNVSRQAEASNVPMIRLVGYDTTFPAFALCHFAEFLELAGLSEQLTDPVARLGQFFESSRQMTRPLTPGPDREELLDDIALIRERAESSSLAEQLDGISLATFTLALRAGVERLFDNGEDWVNKAERLNAEMVLLLLNDLPGCERAALWAHDFHVGRWRNIYLSREQSTHYTTLGYHISRVLGDAYRTLGFEMMAGLVGPHGPGRPAHRIANPPASLAEFVAQAAGVMPSSPECVLFNFSSRSVNVSAGEALNNLSKTIHCYGPPTPPYRAHGCSDAYEAVLLCPTVSPSQML